MNNRRILKLLGDNRSDQPYPGRFGPVPGATLDGGSWTLPLVNLQDPELALIARSQSADADHARFSVRFTREQTLKAFFLGYTNLTITAGISLIGYFDEGRTDIAFRKRFHAYPPVAFTGDLDWRAPNWWSGRPPAESLEGFTQNAFVVFDEDVRARVIDVEIEDPGNPDGFIDFGRLLCLNGWQPVSNYVLGGSLAFETDTVIEKSMSGAEFADVREPFRVYNIGFQHLPEQQALDQGLEMIRRQGIHGEILVVDDFAPLNLHRLSFLARPRQMSAWERSAPKRANIAFQLKERLP